MFFQIFITRLKMTIKDKGALFWTLLFPFILSTLFYFAFSSVGKADTFATIDVAVVDADKDPTFVEMLSSTGLCNVISAKSEEASKLLKEGKVSGIIQVDKELMLTVPSNGINQSILKNILDTYQRTVSTVGTIIDNNPDILATNFLSKLNAMQEFTKDKPIGENTNTLIISFYALIAMTCLMGATQAIVDVDLFQANQSAVAARINVAPTHKLKAFTASISASILLQLVSVILAVAYMDNILKVDFSKDIILVLILIVISCFSCVMFGAAVGSLISKSTNVKIGIVIGAMNILCFLSGMMAPEVKYYVDERMPILSYINPANLITDGLYSLYYYGVSKRYFINIGILLLFGILCCMLTYLKVRRQKYASI